MAGIEFAPDAERNGLANLLATLIAQNLADRPERTGTFERLAGRVAIVAEDAEVALTLEFLRGRLVIHDGIVGLPDLTIRGGSESITDLSRMERIGRFPDPRGPVNLAIFRSLLRRTLRIYGLPRAFPLLLGLGEVLSVGGSGSGSR
jgi:hypothetical protein